MAVSTDWEASAAPVEGSAWGIGLSGRVVLAFTITGGLVFGGFWVAWLTLNHDVASGDLILATTERFLLGAGLGLVHGLALGYHGRDEGISKRWTAWAEIRAAIFTLPALAVAWPVTGWIGSTATTRLGGGTGSITLTLAAWIAGVLMVAYTLSVTARAIKLAYFRWPNRRSGTSLVAAILIASIALAFDPHAALWGVRLRLTHVTLAVLAILLTIWFSGPVITLALRFSRGTVLRPPLGWGPTPVLVVLNVVLAGLLGVALALATRGFHEPPYLLPTIASGRSFGEALLLTFSRATIDEILLRFVPITLMACLLTRGRPRRTLGVAAVSIVGSALLQLAVSSAGAQAIGFRSTAATIQYMGLAVVGPAVLFGAMLWWRGLGTAWLAHAAWLIAAAGIATRG